MDFRIIPSSSVIALERKALVTYAYPEDSGILLKTQVFKTMLWGQILGRIDYRDELHV
jgi:hypothetical protein